MKSSMIFSRGIRKSIIIINKMTAALTAVHINIYIVQELSEDNEVRQEATKYE